MSSFKNLKSKFQGKIPSTPLKKEEIQQPEEEIVYNVALTLQSIIKSYIKAEENGNSTK